jgi:exodeoxyribonuclease VII large subunit
LPVVPQRIAVISSPNAAGYGDFFNQLDGNSFGYRFIHELFPALMQGPEAEGSIISSLEEILKKKDIFDVVVIIRGGGSAVDLSCFDGYPLADRVARSPVPVITGIGHEKDDSVVDMVAHTKMKTPTAVAEFLISGLRGFEEKILGIGERIISGCEGLMKDENYRLHSVIQKLALMPVRITASHENRLTLLQKDLNNGSGRLLSGEDKKLGIMEKAVGHLDPASVLRRGYSITRHKGKVIRDPAFLKKWAVIETRLDKGTLTSIVQDKREGRKSGQGKADDLLPGFD